MCKNVDVGILLDASYSIAGNGTGTRGLAWSREKEFVKQLARELKINSSGPHISVVFFSETAEMWVQFGLFDDPTSFAEAVELVRTIALTPLTKAGQKVPPII